MGRRFVAAAAAATFALGASAAAQDTGAIPAEALKWREMVPKAVYFAPVYGDWEKGAHGKNARIEAGATVPMHTHAQPYHGVLVSGRLTNMLDTRSNRVELAPGDYWYMASNRPHGHVCTSAEPCIFYTHSDGAWDLKLVE